jgi:hypothetical protein
MTALHALDVPNHVVQRWMVGENKVLVNGQPEFVSDVRHDFGLLHRINAQLTLKVLVEFNEIGRIPGVVNNDRNNGSGHLGVVNGRCGRC